mmetsp:Transcript_5698/g.11895  ORF Transcript_5698/g.11895 Transcript_5698/m.11895 type:complete len:90 (-) Transcript_5698:598-867(-)
MAPSRAISLNFESDASLLGQAISLDNKHTGDLHSFTNYLRFSSSKRKVGACFPQTVSYTSRLVVSRKGSFWLARSKSAIPPRISALTRL